MNKAWPDHGAGLGPHTGAAGGGCHVQHVMDWPGGGAVCSIQVNPESHGKCCGLGDRALRAMSLAPMFWTKERWACVVYWGFLKTLWCQL